MKIDNAMKIEDMDTMEKACFALMWVYLVAFIALVGYGAYIVFKLVAGMHGIWSNIT